jgi:pyruvate,water dikinase
MTGIKKIWGRAWRGLLLFLEIIGLREEREVEQESQLARFKLYHAEFRKLLSANNSFLENMAELEARLGGRTPCDLSFLRRKVARMVGDIHHMAASINVISGDRYPAIVAAHDRIVSALTRALAESAPAAEEKYVLDLAEISACLSDVVGGKMANLGEVRNRAGLPAPDGFAVTAAASRLLFSASGLDALLEKEYSAALAPEEIDGLSAVFERRIGESPLPPAVAEAMLAAYDRLGVRAGREPLLAVRSSALREDSSLSFAGQYLSVLNVDRPGLLPAYRRVLASLFSPEAIHYRALHHVSTDAAAMAVGCIEMVAAEVSGIVYSNDPNRPDPGQVVIHAVRGLGVTLADGQSSPEEIVVSREDAPRVLSRQTAIQATMLACCAGGGVVEEEVPPELAAAPILEDREALELADWALRLERHFGGPQDIEWARDRERRVYLVQSRPLRMAPAARRGGMLAGFEVLLESGETASPGIASGPAVRLDEDDDFDSFPAGGILVARRSSPRFVRLMDKARAIVTDAGSTTGHMAALAREFRIPALLNTRNATAVIVPGETITVDATNGFVYRGAVPETVSRERPVGTLSNPHAAGEAELSPFLRSAMDLIVPLNLVNPLAPNFTPERCLTLHDIARFIHERSYEEMFHLGESLGDFRSASWHLDIFLPIDLYIIDIGGGLEPPPSGRKVRLRHLKSAPLVALVRGMLHEKIPRFGPRPIDAGGFFGLMMRHAMTNPEAERTFRDPCYAIVSATYLNYTARVGYHFGVVDSYCGKTPNKNYIHILFRGGAADSVRRGRRAAAIGTILKELGFSAEVHRDVVNARVSKTTTAETEERLEMVGRLMQFMRQLDVAMASDEMADRIVQAFLTGDYGLEGLAKKS